MWRVLLVILLHGTFGCTRRDEWTVSSWVLVHKLHGDWWCMQDLSHENVQRNTQHGGMRSNHWSNTQFKIWETLLGQSMSGELHRQGCVNCEKKSSGMKVKGGNSGHRAHSLVQQAGQKKWEDEGGWRSWYLEEVGSGKERAGCRIAKNHWVPKYAAKCGRRVPRKMSAGERSSKDGIISWQSIRRRRRDRNSCNVNRIERSSARRTWASGLKTMSVSGMSFEDSHAKMEDNGKHIQKESVAEAELDEEIKGLQAADERGGSSASESAGCCMGPTSLRSFLTPGADLAWQHLKSSPKRSREDAWSAASAGASHSSAFPGGRRRKWGGAEDICEPWI